MTHSSNEDVEEVDPFDMDMDAIPDAPDTADDNLYSTEEDRANEKKTDSEIQIDQMEQLLASKRCNTWERGFCDSCLRFLKSKRDAQLSYKQKDVLAKTWAKYSMD